MRGVMLPATEGNRKREKGREREEVGGEWDG